MDCTTVPIRSLRETISLSPRERRLAETLVAARAWTNTDSLCIREFGLQREDWPINARNIVSGSLRSIRRKLERETSHIILMRRGRGGRAGIEYRFEWRKKK